MKRGFWGTLFLSRVFVPTIVALCICLWSTGQVFASAISTVVTYSPSVSVDGLVKGNLDEYCNIFVNYQNGGAVLDGNNGYSWRCIKADGSHVPIDMEALCRWYENSSTAEDRILNFYDPNSWQCFGFAVLKGGLNLQGYCASIGYAGVGPIPADAYSWRCVRADGTGTGINMDSACAWEYGDSIARMQNFYDATSWKCWGQS